VSWPALDTLSRLVRSESQPQFQKTIVLHQLNVLQWLCTAAAPAGESTS
jgi:hypothetical protein